MQIFSIWLCRGFWAFLGSVVTGSASGQARTHWWCEIETYSREQCKEWFILQVCGNSITFIPCASSDHVTQLGKAAINIPANESKELTEKMNWRPTRENTIGDVYEWIGRQDSGHDLLSNNCKHVCENFYAWASASCGWCLGNKSGRGSSRGCDQTDPEIG